MRVFLCSHSGFGDPTSLPHLSFSYTMIFEYVYMGVCECVYKFLRKNQKEQNETYIYLLCVENLTLEKTQRKFKGPKRNQPVAIHLSLSRAWHVGVIGICFCILALCFVWRVSKQHWNLVGVNGWQAP